jgi:hypothetical protein
VPHFPEDPVEWSGVQISLACVLYVSKREYTSAGMWEEATKSMPLVMAQTKEATLITGPG